ncbi:PREDICTED: uncharacterized protein LOC109116793 [Tarenaya hassleriana]|uniref:uncharacterized protein LOC109116793 n=1 Tax=Tarenaya hassleriana TaxID=28532 RepID=UPI0008FD22C5|nr:PREDICTED: uncharacterized protein LOC109116793 [Tarenaya hassleriana]
MEGLIPFLYKAIVQYKNGGTVSSVLFSEHHHSPSASGYYIRLPGDSSGRFRASDLQRVGSGRHRLLETSSSSPSHAPSRNRQVYA